MIEDYVAQVKKVNSKRKSKISNSIGMNEAYRYYAKMCGKLSSQNFRKAIHLINLAIQESLARGEDLILPQKMGEFQLRKFNTSVDFKDGKLITNLPVDWKRTLELWKEDKQAEKEKFLVRLETPSIFRLYYKKQKANYANKSFMQFRTNRSLKQKLKQNINEKKVDAFLVN